MTELSANDSQRSDVAAENLIHRHRLEPVPRPNDELYSLSAISSMNQGEHGTAQLNRSEIVIRDSTESYWLSLLLYQSVRT